MSFWTEKEIDWLKENYPKVGKMKSAEYLGKSEASIRAKAFRLKLKQDRSSPFFNDWQSRAACSKIGKKRPEQAKVILELHAQGKLKMTAERKLRSSAKQKKWIEDNGHPKGMLGKKHNKETKKRISYTSTKTWSDPSYRLNSEEYRQELSDRVHNEFISGKRNSINNYSRCKSGRREDLNNLFVRSRWEANYARYLNYLKRKNIIFKWEYEPDVFVFERIKRGTRSYTPDFKIWEGEKSEPYYVEVKGWMDAKSKTKMNRMAKYFPEVKIRMVGKKEYTEIKNKLSQMIEFWE